MASLRIPLFFAALARVGATSISPVQKVIQLIDDMAVKVRKDLDMTLADFEEFAKFCDDQQVDKTHSTQNSKGEIEALSATIEDSNAKISECESKVSDLTTSIGGAEGELAQAISVREKEHADFIGTEKEMVATVETMNVAAETLKKSLGLVQLTADAKEGLDNVVNGLKQVVEANFVTHEQRSKVEAFLQAQEDSEFTLGAHDSNAIIETIEEMTDKAEGTLADTRKEEMENSHAHAMLKQGMENDINSQRDELSVTTKLKQFTVESLAMATKDLSMEQNSFNEDTKYLSELKRDCQQRAVQFEAESKDGNAELTALGAAKGILAKKFGSFIQTAAATAVEDDDAKALALRKIEQLGKKYHSTALVALAFRASADPFGKVRGMIEDMIAKLLQEAAEEASQKAFCDEELGKSSKSKAQKEESIAKTQARIDKADSTTAKLTGMVATLSKEVAEIDASVTDATAIRTHDKTDFARVEKDLSESEEACAAAISVLREYYEGASLVQVKSKAAVLQQGDGSGILGVLEVAESDFARMLAEARSTEQAAADDYKKLMEDNKLAKATKEVDVKGKQSELKSLKTALSDYNTDKDGVTEELNAVLQYLDKLKPQCETQVPSYAERKAAREQEIEGLKEALTILAGDGMALLQESSNLRSSRSSCSRRRS